MAVKQTAGRDALGEFAPKFAELNDEVLFGQVWSREDKLSLRDRSLVTVIALMAQGLTDSSFRYHLTAAKNNGITRTEIAEILTHAAFYAGWPKAWAAFRMAKEVWAEDAAEDAKAKHQSEMVFPIGACRKIWKCSTLRCPLRTWKGSPHWIPKPVPSLLTTTLQWWNGSPRWWNSAKPTTMQPRRKRTGKCVLTYTQPR